MWLSIRIGNQRLEQVPVRAERSVARHHTPDEKSKRSIMAYPLEEGPPSFEAWAGSGVPAAVCPAVVSALAPAFAAIVASALYAVARLAAF